MRPRMDIKFDVAAALSAIALVITALAGLAKVVGWHV